MDLYENNISLKNADCLSLLEALPDSSVDLIAVDPPYFRVVDADWDRQWKTEADFLLWLRQVLLQYQRVLKPTGSLYLFCGPYLAAKTELLVGEYFDVLNHIVWRKPKGRFLGCNKESLTKFFPQTERIIFAQSAKKVPLEDREFLFEPVRLHLVEHVRRAGLSNRCIDNATGTHMSGHWFGRSQFSFPSEKHYETLRGLAPTLKPYAELKADYDAIRGGHRSRTTGRYFSVSKEVHYTDVWDFPVVNHYPGKHPCEKPAALMEHILLASSSVGGVVLDTFAGSGSTALAAERLGRKFIGCEIGETEFLGACARLRAQIKNTVASGAR